MPLSRHVYTALESVVGQEFITDDKACRLSYAFSRVGTQPHKFLPHPPVAVVMPKSTDEVQRIVRICNRYDVKYKAHSTGYGPFSFPGVADVVMLDLRLMDQIVEIDEKNMFAVIEPLVTAGQLEVEAMKRGLDCHIVSAGPTHSPLASATSAWGIGPKGVYTGYNERNLFGVEWVSPTGEVVRLGPAGRNAGWFSGDGPGPSLRGIMRGLLGAFGGAGVFTKIGYKLYPWPGPGEMESTGEHPQVGWKIPENMKMYSVYWGSDEELAEVFYKLTEARVAYSILKMPTEASNWYLTATNEEYYELFQRGALPFDRKKHWHGLHVVVFGHTAREFEFNDKVFRQIISDTRGEYVELTPRQQEVLFLSQINITYVPRIGRPSGDFTSSLGLEESFGLLPKLHATGARLLERHIKSGKVVDHGPESFWAWPMEGKYLHSENAPVMDVNDLTARAAALEYVEESTVVTQTDSLGFQILPGVRGVWADKLGPGECNVHVWMRKVKNMLDPKNVSDHSWYISPEPPPEAGADK